VYRSDPSPEAGRTHEQCRTNSDMQICVDGRKKRLKFKR